MKYTIIRTNGTRESFTPAKKRPSLDELQKIVGGLIEPVRVKGGELWVNEEGLLLGLPYNVAASQEFMVHLVGDVLYCERAVPVRA